MMFVSSLSIKGTRGGALAEAGQSEEAIPLLMDCFNGRDSNTAKAISAAFLGLIELQKRNFAAAESWLQKSMAADSKSMAGKRLAAALSKNQANRTGATLEIY
jgi:hypothetical protein